jgi:hypothetical protein
MALLSATYDVYIQRKLVRDTGIEEHALRELKRLNSGGPRDRVRTAMSVLHADYPVLEPRCVSNLFDLGAALHRSIGMQLSVRRWGASGDERGAILDHLDLPLTNIAWLEGELTKLEKLTDDRAINQGVDRIVNWSAPGSGCSYDDLGNFSMQPHLVRPRTWAQDPGYLESPRCDFRRQPPDARQSWNNYAETLYGEPIIMRYSDLDPKGIYAVRTTYTGRYNPTMSLTANGKYPVHGPVPSDPSGAVREWPIPHQAIESGKLELKWERTTGRGAQVSEVWLIKKGRLE